MTHEEQRNFTERSTTGKRERNTPKRKKINRRKKAIKSIALCLTCAVVGGVSVNTIDTLKEKITNNKIVREEIDEFQEKAIITNTKRTADFKNYFYDYADIASYMKRENADFSTEAYLAYKNLGENQLEKVLNYTDYDNMSDFLNKNNYASVDEWQEAEKQKIILNNNIGEKQEELNRMQQELFSEGVVKVESNVTKGGK